MIEENFVTNTVNVDFRANYYTYSTDNTFYIFRRLDLFFQYTNYFVKGWNRERNFSLRIKKYF